jgi:hypothetical protein
MPEAAVVFRADTVEIEGLIDLRAGNRAAVITHPHPLYGGSMHNAVVDCLVRVYRREGYTTLRFNFRGVGNSQGAYDHGQGEQDDVRAALEYLHRNGKVSLHLAGYSFGAWVNALTAPAASTVRSMTMVSPPVAFLDFRLVGSLTQLQLVVAGSRDRIAPPELIETMLPVWNPGADLEVVEGADHFYDGCLDRLASILAARLRSGPENERPELD